MSGWYLGLGLSNQMAVGVLHEMDQLKQGWVQGEERFCPKTVKSEETVSHFTILYIPSTKKVTVSLNSFVE